MSDERNPTVGQPDLIWNQMMERMKNEPSNLLRAQGATHMTEPKITREQIEEFCAWALWSMRAEGRTELVEPFYAIRDLALQALDMQPRPPIQKPRRKIVMLGKFEADDWEALASTFRTLEFEASREGGLSTRSVSGGYSTGHIYVCDVDGNMTHDKWAEELDAYLTSLPEPRT